MNILITFHKLRVEQFFMNMQQMTKELPEIQDN